MREGERERARENTAQTIAQVETNELKVKVTAANAEREASKGVPKCAHLHCHAPQT